MYTQVNKSTQGQSWTIKSQNGVLLRICTFFESFGFQSTLYISGFAVYTCYTLLPGCFVIFINTGFKWMVLKAFFLHISHDIWIQCFLFLSPITFDFNHVLVSTSCCTNPAASLLDWYRHTSGTSLSGRIKSFIFYKEKLSKWKLYRIAMSGFK